MPRHFGMLIPSTNTTCEIEFGRLPPDLQVHTARLGKDGSTPFHPSRDADVIYPLQADRGERRPAVLLRHAASLNGPALAGVTMRRLS